MLFPLVFLILLTPLPSFQASIGERKNSTKATNHATSPNTPRPISALLNIKPKPENHSLTIPQVNRTLSDLTKPAVIHNVEKMSEDKPPTSSPTTIVIKEDCIQKKPQKDTSNTVQVQETKLSLKSGSPLVMTHHISVVPGTCTGGCETEMAELKNRVELLEQEMSTLKKKCSLCSEEQCPNDCSGHGKCEVGKCMCHHGFSGQDCSVTSCPLNCTKNGKCVNGKCVCQTGFTGIDCSKGANKNNDEVTVVSSDSSRAKQNTSSTKQTNKADENREEKKQMDDKNVRIIASTIKPIIETRTDEAQHNGTSNKKDKEEWTQEQATSGKNVETKTGLKGPSQTVHNTNNIKQKNKVLSLNKNGTQVPEKKMNGTLKELLNLAIGTNHSAHIKKIKHPLSNGTSVANDKKVVKETNATSFAVKDKKQLQEQGMKMPEKHLDVTASSVKDRKSNQGNITLLKEAISGKKMAEKQLNVTSSSEKDKLHHSSGTAFNTTQKTHGMRNVSLSSEKEKLLMQGNEKPTLKEVTTEQEKVKKQVNVTVSSEKDKTHQGNVTAHTVETPGMKTLTASIKKEKKLYQEKETSSHREVTSGQNKLNQVNITALNKKTSGIKNITTSSEKEKLLVQVARIPIVTSGQKKMEKYVNVTVSKGKDKTLHHGNVTLLKQVASGQKKMEKNPSVTTFSEKEMKLKQAAALNRKTSGMKNVTTSSKKEVALAEGDETLVLTEVMIGQRKVEKNLSVNVSSEKAYKMHQVNITADNGERSQMRNSTTSNQKDKKLVRGDDTPVLKEVTSQSKKVANHLNVTTSSGKDKVNQINVIALNEKTSGIKNSATSSGKVKVIQDNKTENLKKVPSGLNKLGSQVNVTAAIEKDKKSNQSNVTLLKEVTSGQKNMEKLVHVTVSTEQNKKSNQGNVKPLKAVTFGQKKVEKHLNVTITTSEKDKKLNQVNLTAPNEKTSGMRNVSSSSELEKKIVQGNKTVALKGATFGQKNVEKYLNVTTSSGKDKQLIRLNTTALNEKTSGFLTAATSSKKENKNVQDGRTIVLKEVTFGQEKVEKHANVTSSPGKKRFYHGNATAPNEKPHETSSENQKFIQGNETKTTMVKKLLEKLVNVTTIGKDKKQHQDGVTTFKEALPEKTKIDSSFRIITFSRLNNDKNGTALKKTEKYKNATNLTEKNLKHHQGNVTLLTETSSEKRKSDSSNKNKNLQQGDKTTILKKLVCGKEERCENSTTSIQKDQTLHQSHEEGGATNKKTNKQLNTTSVSDEKQTKLYKGNARTTPKITFEKEKEEDQEIVSTQQKVTDTKSYINRTTKLTDIGPVEVHNITATGFVITWEAPQEVFRNFTVIRREVREDFPVDAKKSRAGNKEIVTGNELHSSNQSATKVLPGKSDRRSAEKFSQVLEATARSYHFRNLQPQTKYSVSLYSSGPRVRSKVHRLLVSTGPEPPTELLFSNITETSLTVSWTKPKSIVTGFKVTYTNVANGVKGSMFVDSQLSRILISKLSAGSSYEITVRSVMKAIESEPTRASVVTVPDAPTSLRAVNVTNSKALLVWKPAKAKVDHYILSYGSSKSPNVTVTVMLSGNSVEHQLRDLYRSTLYTIKIMSQINNLKSNPIFTAFTTTSGIKVQVVTPSKVTWNSAIISWKAPRLAFRSYRLTYQVKEEIMEVILNPTVLQYELTNLVASYNYTVKVDGESEGQYISVVSTAFTTAQLPYPYPVDCSQVQLNGAKKSGKAEIYPEGKDGEPVWVYCDMETAGGGWTVLQRRVDGSTNFSRGWKDYSKGFGHLTAEFWLGNDLLHTLTSLVPMSLRIDLRSGNKTAYASYSNFTVGSEVNQYTLELSGYSGTAGNSMSYHNGRPFSTQDKDHSPMSVQCAKSYMGGWWYKNCYKANLNGLYATFSQDQGVVWIDWKGKDVSLPFTEMKLRPNSLNHRTMMTQG